MTIAENAIDRPIYTWIIMLTCLLGGIWGYMEVGRLEDPAFTIKQATIVTTYPGATAEQVAAEVSGPIESEIQNMGEVDKVVSMNRPNVSIIEVHIDTGVNVAKLPQVWTDLRNRVADAELPAGAGTPFVNDRYGDVFGMYYAVTAEGFSDAEKHDLAMLLRRELRAVDGVADVQVDGLPDEAIVVDMDIARSVTMNVPPLALIGALAKADVVSYSGAVEGETTRTLVQRPQGDDSVAAIAGLTLGVGGRIVRMTDVAEVRRMRRDNPQLIVRQDGVEAFTLAVAGMSTENAVTVGERVDAALAGLAPEIPVGVEIVPIYQQHALVDKAVNGFLVSLVTSVAIVILVLGLFMGPRAAVVVGATLLLTVVGSVLFMHFFTIEFERVSLGALIMAMGMLVDNAIVVAENMQIAMLHGRTGREAAGDATRRTQMPLLGATLIAIMAFAAIGFSPDMTGEYLASLFAVIAISLTLSWVLAITVTPYLANRLFKVDNRASDAAYGGPLFRAYGAVLRLSLRLRWLVVVGLVAVTVLCYDAFTRLPQQLFPDSTTPLFYAHLKLPQGASIHETSDQIARLESFLAGQEEVTSTTAFVGQGAARFTLAYQSEKPNPTYGFLIVQTEVLEQIEPLIGALNAFVAEQIPEAEFRTRRIALGPSAETDVEVRISGADPKVLRDLADEVIAVMNAASDKIGRIRTNWREQELVLRPVYATDRAQSAGIDQDDIAQTLLFATDGAPVGTYREAERQIPILLRNNPGAGLALVDHLVYSGSGAYVPLEQVIDGFEFLPENTLVWRHNRELTITVGADAARGVLPATLQREVQPAVEAMDLPIGYGIEWGGDYENANDAVVGVIGQLPGTAVVMVLISVLLFNAMRQPLIIWLLVPMAVNGVVVGLGFADLPFTFASLLGLLSLSGMLIKNGIVLVEEIDLVREEGAGLDDAIVQASTSRLRPVFLAAATTILGMSPLLFDAFFVSMAVTIMGGLAFATVLTLVAAPVFYHIFFHREEMRRTSGASKPEGAPGHIPS
ncbi:MAG: MFS transporter [Rhodobacterales bacterium]|nr:MAG: MFS transporter [Rhodobacterales bacterium]